MLDQLNYHKMAKVVSRMPMSEGQLSCWWWSVVVTTTPLNHSSHSPFPSPTLSSIAWILFKGGIELQQIKSWLENGHRILVVEMRQIE
jgi:hypothetical protein